MREWLKNQPDWLVRALKTAVQAFGGVLVTEIAGILKSGWPESWSILWAALSPIISAALAAAICAGWNIILERLKEDNGDE